MLEGDRKMELLDVIKERRSIRKYQNRQIARADLQKILEAGLYAPNAGGGQRTFLCAIQDRDLCEKIGKLNLAHFDRSKLLGSYVSRDQPSIIDDPTIPSGFYGAPTVCAIFSPRNFLYAVPDAFCCAENMVLEAAALGIASCIIARGEETFAGETGAEILKQLHIPANYLARCFVALGYCAGDYPPIKARKPGRYSIVDQK